MSWIATAIVASSVISYQGSKKAGEAMQQGADDSSRIQQEIADKQLAEYKRQFDLLREDYEPFRQTGLAANERINQLMSGDFSGFTQDPGYQYQVEQGEKAINRLASRQGMLNTPSQVLAYQRNAQGLANQGFGDYFNRLAVVSGRGQAATGAVGAAGQQYAANVGSAYGQLGAGQAQNALLSGQARASGYQNTANIGNNALNQYMMFRGYQNQTRPPATYGAGYTPPGGVSQQSAVPPQDYGAWSTY